MIRELPVDTNNHETLASLQTTINNLINAFFFKADKYPKILTATCLETPLGPMVAIADENALYLLEFAGRKKLLSQIERLCEQLSARMLFGNTPPLLSIKKELTAYFQGKLQVFKTPFVLVGSAFQKGVWEGLWQIPYGETRSYQTQATAMARPLAYRALANANGANRLAILIPCHRVINSNGELGGYGGGVARKKWLLQHEERQQQKSKEN